ncbi:MAG: hypothetical protein C0403_02610 [Desulfobacterium sp.]|nr:hypothetical protein [Desulfobacterium sp.]
MKYLPLKVIIFCIILPPILHLATIQSLEKYLKKIFIAEIENIYTGDTRLLFDGNLSVKDAVNNNIDNYLQKNKLIPWGVKLNVLVITKSGAIIYPSFEEEDSLTPPSRKQIASENFAILSEGLNLQIDIFLERSSVLVISIFSTYIMLSLLTLSYLYRRGAMKAKMEEKHREEELSRMIEIEKENQKRMNMLTEDKTILANEFKRIKNILEDSKVTTLKNEEGMIEEIISLEEKIKNIHDLYDEQQEENMELKEIIGKYEKGEFKTRKQKEKGSKQVTKRFTSLYKSISFHNRAILGFADLTDDMQIKAEEIIHKMEIDSNLVKVKRKVLLKKNPEAVFEIPFSYNGRIYFSKGKDGKVNILSIGTKNTQEKDLAFIDSI